MMLTKSIFGGQFCALKTLVKQKILNKKRIKYLSKYWKIKQNISFITWLCYIFTFFFFKKQAKIY
jgi:hypothetical protein